MQSWSVSMTFLSVYFSLFPDLSCRLLMAPQNYSRLPSFTEERPKNEADVFRITAISELKSLTKDQNWKISLIKKCTETVWTNYKNKNYRLHLWGNSIWMTKRVSLSSSQSYFFICLNILEIFHSKVIFILLTGGFFSL